MKILVLNCGSSSIKYQLLDMTNEGLLASGLVDRVGMKKGLLSHKPTGKDKHKAELEIKDHTQGVELILSALTCKTHGVIDDIHEIAVVGHRIVHGGERFKGSTIVNPEVTAYLEDCVSLAPLHNPANLKGIYAMQKILPNVPQCTTFDTAFHQSMPDYSYMYAIPYELYEKNKIRRYGFHGTSHRYVSEKAAEVFGRKDLKIISCHLGNGASVAAIDSGKSVDTSMGFTPVEGLIMGTRCGDLDLGAMMHIMKIKNMDVDAANLFINKECGVLGVSCLSSDMRDLEEAAWVENGDKKADLALNMYFYRIKKYIGSYAAAMKGVDVIIFTGGVGENGGETREIICEGLEFMGVEFDKEVNDGVRSKLLEISKPESKVKVMIIPTNEELIIARDAYRLTKSN